MKITNLIFLFLLTFLFVVGCQEYFIEDKTSTPINFKVAFIGDQGLNDNSKAVLQLIKDEQTDMVLHQGDFDYGDDADEWDKQINDILGQNFPYFASIGNHDVKSWPDYQLKLEERLNRIDGANCDGNLGVKSSCTYQGLFFILSGVGTKGIRHDAYIKKQLLEKTKLEIEKGNQKKL